MKKITFIIILLVSYKIFCFSNENLYRIKLENKWGFIDYNGNVIIPCIYSSVTDFQDGICKVSLGKDEFFINMQNEKVETEKKEFVYSSPFSIDHVSGVIPLKIPSGYKLSCSAACLGENMFTVCKINNEDYVGVIDVNGNIVIETKLFDIGVFQNGMAPFKYGHNGIDGYIRKDGKVFDFSKR